MRLLFIGVGGAFAIMLGLIAGLIIQPRPSAQQKPAESPSPSPGWIEYSNHPSVVGDQNITRPETGSEQTRSAPLVASASATPEASNGVMFGDEQKEQAYQAMKQRKEALQTVLPPQINSSDPRAIGAEINNYVNELGLRAQDYQKARDTLRQQLTPDEQTRLRQVDPQQ